jgi:hypothetical protein
MTDSRSAWPTFIFVSQTTYRVAAPSVARALAWFADETDMDLDIETVDFGHVEVIEQVPATATKSEG